MNAFTDTVKAISRTIRHLVCLFTEHLHVLSSNLDPVKDCSHSNRKLLEHSIKPRILAYHYTFSFAVLFYVVVDTFAVLFQNSFGYRSDGLPELYTHKVFPNELWPQSDLVMYLGFLMGLFIYGSLMWNPILKHKFIMFLVFNKKFKSFKIYMNNQEVPPGESAQIYRFRKKAKLILTIMMGIMFVQAEFFHVSQFILHFTATYRNYCLFFYTPITYAYLCHSALFTRYYFVYTSRIILIQQSTKLKNLQTLSANVNINSKSTKVFQKANHSWLQYRHIYEQVVQLNEQIEAHDSLWRSILSCYFAVYIFEVSFYLYMLIFLSKISMESEHKSFFFVFPIDFASTLLFITSECTKIVRKNGKILQAMRMLSYQLRRECKLNAQQLLLLDSIEAKHKRLAHVGFSFLNGAQINSKVFEMTLAAVSTLFLRILKK